MTMSEDMGFPVFQYGCLAFFGWLDDLIFTPYVKMKSLGHGHSILNVFLISLRVLLHQHLSTYLSRGMITSLI